MKERPYEFEKKEGINCNNTKCCFYNTSGKYKQNCRAGIKYNKSFLPYCIKYIPEYIPYAAKKNIMINEKL